MVVVACEYAVVLPFKLSAETTRICAEGVIRKSVDVSVCLFFLEKAVPLPTPLESARNSVGRLAALHSGP